MNKSEKIAKLARHEIGWWKAHHRRQKDLFVLEMTYLYVLQFGIDEDAARQAVLFRAEAADYHDEAEKYEDAGDQSQADVYWRRAEESLLKHFAILEEHNTDSE